MINEIQLGLARLGVFGSCCQGGKAGFRSIEGRLCQVKDAYVITYKENFQSYVKVLEDRILVPIRKLEEIYFKGPVFNLETEDHTYLVNNLVVHNCWNLVACLHTETMIERGLLPKELNDLPTHYIDNTIDPPSDGGWLSKLDVEHDVGLEPEEDSKPTSLPSQPPVLHKFTIGQKVRTKILSLEGTIDHYHETHKDCYYVKIPQMVPNLSVLHECELEAVNG